MKYRKVVKEISKKTCDVTPKENDHWRLHGPRRQTQKVARMEVTFSEDHSVQKA